MINTIKDWVKSPEGIDALKTTAYIGGGSLLGILANRLFGKNNWKYDALAAILGGTGGYGIKRLNDPKFIPGSSLQEQRKQQQTQANVAQENVKAAVKEVFGNESQSSKEKTSSTKEKTSSPKEEPTHNAEHKTSKIPNSIVEQAKKQVLAPVQDLGLSMSSGVTPTPFVDLHENEDARMKRLNEERRSILYEGNTDAATDFMIELRAKELYRQYKDKKLERASDNARKERQIIEARPLLYYLVNGDVSRFYKRKLTNTVKKLSNKAWDVLGLTKLPAISVDPAIEKTYQKLKNERENLSKFK